MNIYAANNYAIKYIKKQVTELQEEINQVIFEDFNKFLYETDISAKVKKKKSLQKNIEDLNNK